MKLIFVFLVLLTIVSAFIVLLLAVLYGPYFYFGFLVFALLIFFCYKIHKKITFTRIIDNLRSQWGKEDIRERNFAEIDNLFIYSTALHQEKGSFIDDHTWTDLNMNEIYSRIDRTLTSPGECVLYNILRMPVLSDSILKKRSEIVRLLHVNKEIRENIQSNLCGLGKQKYNGIEGVK